MNGVDTLKSLLPKDIKFKLQKLYYIAFHRNNIETKKTYGKLHPDDTIYVIRPSDNTAEGLLSLLLNVMKHLYYAEYMRYIPVVDFQNYETQYSDRGGCNAWELYFSQPGNISLEEAYESKNVILSGVFFGSEEIRGKIINRVDSLDRKILKENKEFLFGRISISDDIMKCVEDELDKLNVKNMLGLYMRGTDYTELRPSGHPIQPTFEQIEEEVEKYRTYGFQGIFLVTEDANIYKRAKSTYGEEIHIVSFDRFISNYDGNGYLCKSPSINEISDNQYERGKNYLVKIIILSKCRWLIAGNTKGSWGACLFNGGNYEKKTIFNLGEYK